MNKQSALWLNIRYDFITNEINLLDAKLGYFRIPFYLEISNKKRLKVNSLDCNGRILSEIFFPFDEIFRQGIFSPETGEVETVININKDSEEFQFIIPYSCDIQRIGLFFESFSILNENRSNDFFIDIKEINKLINITKGKSDHDIINDIITFYDMENDNPMIIAIMGDGYTEKELGKWKQDAKSIVEKFLSDPLMEKLKHCFRFVRIDVISQDSGISIGNNNKNTALKMYLGCNNIDRLLCINVNIAKAVANKSLGYGGYDQILAVANTTQYGGAGYTGVGTLTLHPSADQLALHEFGHSAYGLADEYDYGTCNIHGEPTEPNVTIENIREKIKWKHLILPSTPIPTYNAQNGEIGLFEGANYCKKGVYRPVLNSKMRTLGLPWYSVNEERIIQVMKHFCIMK